jgi:hypothetical protein
LVAPADIPDDKLHDEIRFWKINFDEEVDEENLRDQSPDKIFKAAFKLMQGDRAEAYEGISLLEGTFPDAQISHKIRISFTRRTQNE